MRPISGIVTRTAAALAATGQSMSAIRLAAIVGSPADCPPILSVVLKSAACGASRPDSGFTLSASERPEDHRVALDPAALAELDASYLAMAWQVGAWDVARTERAPLPPGSNPADPAHGLAHLVHDPYTIALAGHAREPMPCPVDGADWITEAALRGWITWLCKPLWHGPAIRAGWIAKDSTLQADGSRLSRERPWTAWEPVIRGRDHQTIIRMGRAPHGNRGNRHAH